MKPALEITLDFSNLSNESTFLIITGDDKEAWIRIRTEKDDDYSERSIQLDPLEIDLVISALNLFKERILNPRKVETE